MNLRFIFLGVVLFLFFPLIGQNKIKWNSWDTCSDKIQKANRKFIVYFYYDGCKWCRHLEEETFDNDQIARFINQNYYAFRVNALSEGKLTLGDKTYTSVRIGKYDFNEIAVDLLAGDMSFPSVVFLDEKFKKIQSHSGYVNQHSFEMILSYFAGNHHKNTIFKRYANSYCKDSHFNALVNDKN
jgi:thioredoxin-related protein